MALKKEVVEKLAALVTAGFGLAAALAWNDAILTLFAENGSLHFIANFGRWGYPIAITILAVIFTIWIGKISERAKGRDEKAKRKK